MSKIQSKKVLITGGAAGIGKIMSRMMLEKGAEVVIWDINEQNMTDTVEELSKIGKISSIKADVSSPEQIKKAAEETKKRVGKVDILINNAGIVVGKYFNEHKIDDINNTININTNAPMFITLEFLQDMTDQNFGHVCNIASSAGLISNPKMSVYAASKWAVIGWSDSLRIEMQKLKKQVKVTTVTPYYINTGMFDGVKSIVPILKPEKAAKKIIRGIERNKIFVGMPWNVRFIRFMQGVLPVRGFDWIVGDLMGIYKTMDKFKGHGK